MLLDDTLRSEVGIYLEVMLAFNSIDHELIWKYIIVVASQLEYCCIRMLLVSEKGDPYKFWEYEERTTLNQAAQKMKEKNLLSSEEFQIIKDIGKLRNSVLHRKALTGITEYAEYKGRKVFHDSDAVKEFIKDSEAVTNTINEWVKKNSDYLSGTPDTEGVV